VCGDRDLDGAYAPGTAFSALTGILAVAHGHRARLRRTGADVVVE
jgi:hypothetical protein